MNRQTHNGNTSICNILRHVCRINEHPICFLPDSIKVRYVKGLACVLHNISGGDSTMKMLFEQWAYSILGHAATNLFSKHDDRYVAAALSLNRVGFKFFRCKHEFFFDCFYLVETFDKSLLPKLNEYLASVGRNMFTKEALRLTNEYFANSLGDIKAKGSLIKHRELNRSFQSKRTFRILVVANVSAGKSTLINALLGYEFNKVRTTACTSRLCAIYNKPTDDGITYMKDGAITYDQCVETHNSDETDSIGLNFQSMLGGYEIEIIDTPGVNNAMDTQHWSITTNAIKENNYEAIIFISNGQYNGTTDERMILDFIKKNSKKPVLFTLNQLDRFKSSVDSIADMIADYKRELKTIGFKTPCVYPLSAQYALLMRRKDELDDDKRYELGLLTKRCSKDFYDLQRYIGEPSSSEIERTGIIEMETAIIKLIKQH